MGKKSLGIYFGTKIISVVETLGTKILNKVQFSRTILTSNDLEEKVPEEVKLVALFQEELRKNKIETKDVSLCLAGKDLIIRTFEVPVLPANELPNIINFEVKKYIPFKIDNLIYDFQIKLDKSSHKYQVLYIGIKKEDLDKYISIMHQLNIKINALEYSAFSLLRFLKLAKIKKKGIVAIISVDSNEGDEINFTILENNFPLFSRDIILTEADMLTVPEGTPFNSPLEKIKNEIKVSLDYYNRKFPGKKIEKAVFICNEVDRSELDLFFKDIVLPAEFIDANKIMGRSQAFSLGYIKSYSSSLSNLIKSDIKIDVTAVKAKPKVEREIKGALEENFLLSGIEIDPRFIMIGALICLIAFAYNIPRKIYLQKEITDAAASRPLLSKIDPNSSFEQLIEAEKKYDKNISTLNEIITKQPYLTELLNVIPKIMPSDIRLTDFSYNRKDDKYAELILKGVAYLGDSDKELKLISSFVSVIKDDPNFKKYFSDIAISGMDQNQVEKISVTNFTINCKS